MEGKQILHKSKTKQISALPSSGPLFFYSQLTTFNSTLSTDSKLYTLNSQLTTNPCPSTPSIFGSSSPSSLACIGSFQPSTTNRERSCELSALYGLEAGVYSCVARGYIDNLLGESLGLTTDNPMERKGLLGSSPPN